MKTSRTAKEPSKKPVVIGLRGFENISAVEGIRLNASSRQMFAQFQKDGLTAEERRAIIMAKHARKA